MTDANEGLHDGLPQLSQLEIERWQKLLLLQDNVRAQIENFVMQLMLKYKLDPDKVSFDFNTGRFVKREQVNR